MAVSLVDLLSAAVSTMPQRRAVCEPHGAALTYADLDAASAALAARLSSRRGDRVGILAPKSADTVVALWAAMRTGAAYVPVDPAAPPARVARIARDCEMTSILASDALVESLDAVRVAVPEIQVVPIDGVARHSAGPTESSEPLYASPVSEQDLAYILYTSGSTGVPKGVMVSHGAALGFINWAVHTFDLTSDDVLSSHAPFHFDLSVFDLYAAAAVGAAVVVLDEETVRFPTMSADVLEHDRISVWYSVPRALRRMVNAGRLATRDLSALRTVLFAGEVYPGGELRALQAALPVRVQLFNLFGSTETNVCTYWHVPAATEWHDEEPSIGVDCSSCEGMIVDHELRPVEAGQSGELLVRGTTLMSGYWRDPESTGRVLIDELTYPHLGGRFCRTGDIVSRDATGLYRFHGRRDHMVKIRGHRVELGEVEAALHRVEDVREAVVIAAERAYPDGGCGLELVAFVVAQDEDVVADRMTAIRRALSRTLPTYMLPAEVHSLTAFPLTSSGKVDRGALLAMVSSDVSRSQGYRARANVLDTVREFLLSELRIPDAYHLDPDLPLVKRGVLDSMGVLQVVAFLDQAYGIRMDDTDVLSENVGTLSAIAALVTRRGRPTIDGH